MWVAVGYGRLRPAGGEGGCPSSPAIISLTTFAPTSVFSSSLSLRSGTPRREAAETATAGRTGVSAPKWNPETAAEVRASTASMARESSRTVATARTVETEQNRSVTEPPRYHVSESSRHHRT
jgi:hypothetical protein